MPHIRPHGGPAAGGFTLVELLVVVSIVGVLTALLLPAVSKARGQANSLACKSNLHQIGAAIQIYLSSSRGVLPYGYWDGSFNPSTGADTGFDARHAADWTVLLQSSISSMAGATLDDNAPNGTKSAVRSMFMDPEAPPGDTLNSFMLTIAQYGVHPRLMPLMGTEDKYQELGAPPGLKIFLRPYRASHIKRSAEIALIFDASLAPQLGGGWTVWPTPVTLNLDAGRLNFDTYLTDQYNLATTPGYSCDQPVDLSPQQTGAANLDTTGNAQNIRFRHNNNRLCNVLLADMHVDQFDMSPAGQTGITRAQIDVNP